MRRRRQWRDFIYLEVSEYEELFDHYFSTGDFEQAVNLIQAGCKAHPYGVIKFETRRGSP